MPFGVLERQGVTHLWALGHACSVWWDPTLAAETVINCVVIHNDLQAQLAPQEA